MMLAKTTGAGHTSRSSYAERLEHYLCIREYEYCMINRWKGSLKRTFLENSTLPLKNGIDKRRAIYLWLVAQFRPSLPHSPVVHDGFISQKLTAQLVGAAATQGLLQEGKSL